MKTTPQKIVIIDDHPLIAKSLEDICSSLKWDAKIYSFFDVKSFESHIFKAAPDLFLIDLQIQNDDGRETVKNVKDEYKETKIIVISSFEDPIVIRSAFAAGADAYIIKNATFEEMKTGIIDIWKGKKFIQKQVEDAITKAGTFPGQRALKVPRLTEREKTILGLIMEEKTNKEIAGILFLSEKTIEVHRSNLILKCDVKNTVGLVKKAVEWGLIQ